MHTFSQEMLTESHLPPDNHLLQSCLYLHNPQKISCCWDGSGASLTTSQSEHDMDIGHCCMTCATVCRHNCAYLSAGPTGRLSLLHDMCTSMSSQLCILEGRSYRKTVVAGMTAVHPDNKPLRM